MNGRNLFSYNPQFILIIYFLWDETLYNIVIFKGFLVSLDFQQMKLVILFSDTLQNTLILTMRTLWATITENAGPEMLA